MANSTTVITDLNSVYNNGPQGTTPANAVAPAGPIMDYIGNTNLMIVKAKELAYLIGKVIADTDSSGDVTNYNLLIGIQNILK